TWTRVDGGNPNACRGDARPKGSGIRKSDRARESGRGGADNHVHRNRGCKSGFSGLGVRTVEPSAGRKPAGERVAGYDVGKHRGRGGGNGSARARHNGERGG